MKPTWTLWQTILMRLLAFVGALNLVYALLFFLLNPKRPNLASVNFAAEGIVVHLLYTGGFGLLCYGLGQWSKGEKAIAPVLVGVSNLGLIFLLTWNGLVPNQLWMRDAQILVPMERSLEKLTEQIGLSGSKCSESSEQVDALKAHFNEVGNGMEATHNDLLRIERLLLEQRSHKKPWWKFR